MNKKKISAWFINISVEPYKGALRNSTNLFSFREAERVAEILSDLRVFMCATPLTQKIVAMGKKGFSIRKIAKALKKSPTTIYYHLHKEQTQ